MTISTQTMNMKLTKNTNQTARRDHNGKEARTILLILTNMLREKTMMQMARLQIQNQLAKVYHLLEDTIIRLDKQLGVLGVPIRDVKAVIPSQKV